MTNRVLWTIYFAPQLIIHRWLKDLSTKTNSQTQSQEKLLKFIAIFPYHLSVESQKYLISHSVEALTGGTFPDIPDDTEALHGANLGISTGQDTNCDSVRLEETYGYRENPVIVGLWTC